MSRLAEARYMYKVDLQAEYEFNINDTVRIDLNAVVRIAGQSDWFRGFEGRIGTVVRRDEHWGAGNRANNYEVQFPDGVSVVVLEKDLEKVDTI